MGVSQSLSESLTLIQAPILARYVHDHWFISLLALFDCSEWCEMTNIARLPLDVLLTFLLVSIFSSSDGAYSTGDLVVEYS